MTRKLNPILFASLLIVILVGMLALNWRPTRAATKKVYKSELVNTGSIQATLDERAAEGWQLVAVTAYSNSTLLVFEKQ
jgi:hypothetical protein